MRRAGDSLRDTDKRERKIKQTRGAILRTSSGKAGQETDNKTHQFLLPRRVMGQRAQGGSQNRTSPGRVVSTDRIHNNQPAGHQEIGGEILQSPGHLRTEWIKEGKCALKWTRLSCQGFRENEVRLSLFIMTYNLGNIFRMLALPETIKSWSLRTIQLKLIKLGGRLIKHARYYYLLLAETTINEQLWQSIMQKINRLCPAPG